MKVLKKKSVDPKNIIGNIESRGAGLADCMVGSINAHKLRMVLNLPFKETYNIGFYNHGSW